ncbi:hypothetical protein [Kribbella sp. NPDC050470]|uniref:hypothetical protein n=1 Tax=unclassified Kribbella TaxID=2644121 RepID=UPI0037B2C799
MREVLAPWRASFHDRQVARSEFALDAQLVASVLGNPRGTPVLSACNIQVGKCHSDHQSSGGLSLADLVSGFPIGVRC